MSETTTCQKCHGRGTYVHPDMGSLICDCRSLWENMGASLAHLPHPAVAEVTRLEAALSAAEAREAQYRGALEEIRLMHRNHSQTLSSCSVGNEMGLIAEGALSAADGAGESEEGHNG